MQHCWFTLITVQSKFCFATKYNPIGYNKIAVIDFGYVGLPLAMAFGNQHRIKGFDIVANRIDQLSKCVYHTTKQQTIR